MSGRLFHPISRRAALRTAGLGGLASMFAGPAGAAGKRLVCGTVGGAWLEGIRKFFVEDTGFTQTYDADVVWDVQTDAAMITKVMGSCGHPVEDVLQAQPERAVRVAGMNCLVDLDPRIVTNLADVPQEYRSGGYFAATNRLLGGLVYNTKHVERPTSWDDLANPKYQGKIGIPALGWIGQELLYAVNQSHGGTEDNIDPGIAFLAKVVRGNNAVMIQSAQMADAALQREEVWMLVTWLGRTLNLQNSGFPADIYFPDKFVYSDIGYIIPAGPNAELAQHFVNITLDPIVQQKMFEKFLYQPTNRKTVIRPELSKATLPDYAKGRAVKVDWAKTGQNADRDLQRWNREVLGS